jgi:hypothetical protein
MNSKQVLNLKPNTWIVFKEGSKEFVGLFVNIFDYFKNGERLYVSASVYDPILLETYVVHSTRIIKTLETLKIPSMSKKV